MICCYEMRKGRGSCVEPSSLKKFGSMFDAEAIHAQIPSNIEPNYQRTWCNGHKTGHASFLSSYIANLPLVSPMFVLGLGATNSLPPLAKWTQTEQGRLPFFSLWRTNVAHTAGGTHLIQIANAEVDVELVPKNLLELVAWRVRGLLTVGDQPPAQGFSQLVDMPVPLIVQGPFPFYLHTPLPSIGCCTADRQINAGNSFLPGLSLVHGSNHLRFCVAALLRSHGLAHKTLLTDTFIAFLRCAMRLLQEAQKS